MTTRLLSRHWRSELCWWVWIDIGLGAGGLMYKAVVDDFGTLVRVSPVV